MKVLEYPYPCPACAGAVTLATGPGRTRRVHAVANVLMPASLAVPTCQQCGTEWLDAADAARIDAAMAAAYRQALCAGAVQLVAALPAAGVVAEVEAALGLTRGYLSRIRAGAKAPSAGLVADLALIAVDPRRRLAELQVFWSGAAQES